jgi:hypothetical protein
VHQNVGDVVAVASLPELGSSVNDKVDVDVTNLHVPVTVALTVKVFIPPASAMLPVIITINAIAAATNNFFMTTSLILLIEAAIDSG